jgi:translation initiation factor IF-1
MDQNSSRTSLNPNVPEPILIGRADAMRGNAAEMQEENVSDRPQYALRFISGKYQGGEFPLKMDREVVIGRSSDLDMVLVEDMVSRKHAKISTTNGQVIIQDMGSTNGTFVNGEKVKRVRLREGDRILIGTSIIKLISMDETSADSIAGSGAVAAGGEPRQATSAGGRRTASTTRSMAGTIDEIPLPTCCSCYRRAKRVACWRFKTRGA